MIKCEEVY